MAQLSTFRSLRAASTSSSGPRVPLASSNASLASKSKPSIAKRLTHVYRASRPSYTLSSVKHYSSNTPSASVGEAIEQLAQRQEDSTQTPNAFVRPSTQPTMGDKTVDASLQKTITVEDIADDHPELLKTRYRGFGLSDKTPEEVASFEHLERQASDVLTQATSSGDVHIIRELATHARELYEQYLVATGNHGATPGVLFHLGLACGMLHDYESQIECLRVALLRDEGLIPAKRYLADAFQALGRHPEAVHYYDEYFNDFPRYYGRLVNDNGDIEVGGAKYNMTSESILADTVFNRGRSYFAMGTLGIDAAKEDFKAIVRLNGKHKANSLYYMGLAELQGKDYWKSIKYFDLALQTGPSAWFMYKGRADAWRALGKEDRAEDDERQAHVLRRQRHWDHELDSTVRSTPEFDEAKYIHQGSIANNPFEKK